MYSVYCILDLELFLYRYVISFVSNQSTLTLNLSLPPLDLKKAQIISTTYTHTLSHFLYHIYTYITIFYYKHSHMLTLSLPHTQPFFTVFSGDHGAQNTAPITVGGQSVDRCQCLTSSSSSNLKWSQSLKYSWQGSGVRLKRLVYSNYFQEHLYTSSRQSLSNLHTHTHVANLPHIRPYPPPCPVQ